MRNRILWVIALVAGCKGAQPSSTGSGSGSGKAAPAPITMHVVTTPLPTVGADARLAPVSDPVPAHELLIDAAGHIAAFAADKTWPGVLLEVDTENALDLEELEKVGNAVHRDLKDEHDARVVAEERAGHERELARLMKEGMSEDEARDTMAHTRYEPNVGRMGRVLYAERPPSAIRAAGDSSTIRDAVPARMPRLTAIVSDTFPPEPFLFVAAKTGRATRLVDAIIATSGGMIAVAAPQGVRALRLRFKHIDPSRAYIERMPWTPWIELRVGNGTVDIEAVPGTPVRITGAVDAATLQKTIAKLRAERPAIADQTVDVLVDDAADVQYFVSVLAAVDLANVTEIGLGRGPRASDGEPMRGKPLTIIPIPAVELDPGEGGTVPVHEMIEAHMVQIRYCFETAGAGPVVIHAKKDRTTSAVLAEIEGVATPVAKCVVKELEEPIAHQTVAFKVRFVRVE